ncbi:uncharacterized protein [Rutidosis leptorrhynchoides]|uniref:uncharacterized protein n=1 Tax=Rutidosis leptorrhynchoides TaxID=125765 RepID=UPI003A990D03
MAACSTKVTLKLLIDTNSKKVLFAEANKEFVDFLFYILSLPLGTVIKLLKKNSMVGSLGKLYESIENLSNTYMQLNQSKDAVLNPRVPNFGAQVPLLLSYDDVSLTKEFYACCNSYNHQYVADYSGASCPAGCGCSMTRKLTYVARKDAVKESAEVGGFVKGVVTYMVMDDLEVKPMSTISSISILNTFNVKEVGALEEKVVSFGMNEFRSLLTWFEAAEGFIAVQQRAYHCVPHVLIKLAALLPK